MSKSDKYMLSKFEARNGFDYPSSVIQNWNDMDKVENLELNRRAEYPKYWVILAFVSPAKVDKIFLTCNYLFLILRIYNKYKLIFEINL